MSIDAGAKVAIILLACGPCVVIVNLLGQVCTLGRAPRTKETLLDFHEWCRVTRHPLVFRGLTGCQRTSRVWGVTKKLVPQVCLPLQCLKRLLHLRTSCALNNYNYMIHHVLIYRKHPN